MSKQINLDDVFRSGLGSLHEPFDEGAWLNMQNKLAAEAVKPKFWLPFLNKKTLNIFIGMILLSLIVTSFFLLNAKTEVSSPSSTTSSAPIVISNNGGASSNNSSQAKLNTYTGILSPKAVNGNAYSSFSLVKQSTPVKSGTVGRNEPGSIFPGENKTNAADVKIIVSPIENTRIKPKFKKAKIKNSFKPLSVYVRPSCREHYNCATMGLHFNYLQPLSAYASIGQRAGLGFDIEGYTRNLTPGRYYGLFLGGSGSVAWTGKSPKTEITLNTPKSDPGVTFLQNVYGDFNFIGKVEFGRGDIKFYATGFVGWRGAFVSQEIQSKKQIEGFENSSKNVSSMNMLQWGGGAGIRYHFAPGVSLDIRGVYEDADFMRLANVRRSSYNEFTGKYNLSYNFVEPQLLSIRVGLLFCFDNVDTYSDHNYNRSSSGNGRIYLPTPSSGGKSPVQIKPVTPKVGR